MLNITKSALSKSQHDIVRALVEPYRIELTEYTPIWQKPRMFRQPTNDEIENQCSELLTNDVIEMSNSPPTSRPPSLPPSGEYTILG